MDFRPLGARLSNWGRWGSDDERGTINLITPDRLVAAAKLVKKGSIISLSIPFDRDGPQQGSTGPSGRNNPLHLMSALNDSLGLSGGVRMADDYVIMPLQCATQWDGLAHVSYDDYIYNGYPATSVTAGGASRNAIDKLASGVAGRGVLLDVATYMNVPWLEPGYVITPADLDATLAWQGDVAVGAGDIVLIRTGVRRALLDPTVADDFRTAKPGLGIDCCEWLRTRDVAAVASDNNAVEVLPSEDPEFALPLHCVLIRDVGMTLGEIFYLEELSADCQKDGIWDFFFCAPPLPVSNAVGSPINPLAIK